MSKKTKLNRKQLETLVRSKLQEKLNLQEDVGDVFGKQAASVAGGKDPTMEMGERGSYKAEDEVSADSWSKPVARNQSMQEAQLDEWNPLQSMSDYYHGTGDWGTGGTVGGVPAKSAARALGQNWWDMKRDDSPPEAPEDQRPLQEETPPATTMTDMPDVDDMDMPDMPDVDDVGDIPGVTEQTDKEWYDIQLFESLKKTWIK